MSFRFFIFCLMTVSLFGLNGCDSEPPRLMKANTPFETDEERDNHIAHMRTHHMHALKHKRDETMYQGIRTKDHSLKACINCHVPESHNGKILRHTDQEHFCTTCHSYVAAKLNCFECHVDHPVNNTAVADSSNYEQKAEASITDSDISTIIDLSKLNKQELTDLVFKYSNRKEKPNKSGGVSFKDQDKTKTDTNEAKSE